jgi:hypothetical protein
MQGDPTDKDGIVITLYNFKISFIEDAMANDKYGDRVGEGSEN